MAVVEVSVSLDVDVKRCTPQVRAWIDLEPEVGLDREMELPLRCSRPREWVGAFVVGETQVQHFLYRLGFVAHPGAQWSLTVRHRNLGRDLLVDGDTLAIGKCYLVGNCSLIPRALGQPAVDSAITTLRQWPSTHSVKRVNEPNLVLLDRDGRG